MRGGGWGWGVGVKSKEQKEKNIVALEGKPVKNIAACNGGELDLESLACLLDSLVGSV